MDFSNALNKLQVDHRLMEELFHQFGQADERMRQSIAEEALMKLEIHTNLEEDLIYPAVRHTLPEKDLIDDAIEEHHVMSLLGRELRTMQVTDAGYKAKFRVLSQIVRHHITEEETRIFPEATTAGFDWSALDQPTAILSNKLAHKLEHQNKLAKDSPP